MDCGVDCLFELVFDTVSDLYFIVESLGFLRCGEKLAYGCLVFNMLADELVD